MTFISPRRIWRECSAYKYVPRVILPPSIRSPTIPDLVFCVVDLFSLTYTYFLNGEQKAKHGSPKD